MTDLKTILPTFALAIALMAGSASAQTSTKALQGKLVRGSEAMGAKIFNQKGESLGEINDILFDENTGGMTHAVLAIGGFLGIGEKLTAVPWKFIKQAKKTHPASSSTWINRS